MFHLKVSCRGVWVLVLVSQRDFPSAWEVRVRFWNNRPGGRGRRSGSGSRVTEKKRCSGWNVGVVQQQHCVRIQQGALKDYLIRICGSVSGLECVSPEENVIRERPLAQKNTQD